MNREKLERHLASYRKKLHDKEEKVQAERTERAELLAWYRGWTAARLRAMTEDDLYPYIAKLWAMLSWGNKHYVVDRLIDDNGMEAIRSELAELIWGQPSVASRWDRFRMRIKGMGPAMISELLCRSHRQDCAIWNRRTWVGLNYLEVRNLPRHDYQLTGKRYVELSGKVGEIAQSMRKSGLAEYDMLAADYFIWEELQAESNLSALHASRESDEPAKDENKLAAVSEKTGEFIHNDVRDKLADIGQWLGFRSSVEVKVADGSRVDAIWESTIGNMGRVIYAFEVQTKGSLDSLIMNLLKALNNPAVQGVVAVSDSGQIEKIRTHAKPVRGLGDKLRFWDYTDVLVTHERLQSVNESINKLQLVPEGF